MIKSVYIHIPFCKNICSYCDFCKNYYDENIAKKYLDALSNEIKKKYKNEVLDTLYIGGGTPSCLSLENLEKLFNVLNVFVLSENYEFTFECNYEDLNEKLLLLLKENRVNRISIGLQTINKKYEMFLERNIDKKMMRAKIDLTKKYFNNINIDLMYGFFNESMDDLKKDLDFFLNLDVNHISTYCLIIEEHTKLSINKAKELNDDLQSNMYYEIIKKLKANVYNHYEISNFSKNEYESKHNLTYWNNDEYYGFGLGASGFVNKIRYDNTKSISKYLNGNYLLNEEIIDVNREVEDEIMLNLRKTSGINKKNFKAKYGKNLKEIYEVSDLVNKGLLIENENQIFIPKEMLFVSNEIILMVLERRK